VRIVFLISVATVLAVMFVANPVWAAGWYLMIPPVRDGPTMYARSMVALVSAVDTGAPFDAWKTVSSFDSASACNSARVKQRLFELEQAREARQRALNNFASVSFEDRLVITLEKQYIEALCISVDDPRLLAVAVRKQWRLLIPPLIEKYQNPVKYLDEHLDKNAPLKRWEIKSSHASEWECEAQKEFGVLTALNSLGEKEIDRSRLELTRLDPKSKQWEEFFRYVVFRDAQCIVADDPRLK
jgi:hypothetical protein